ncbi:MAG: type II toxin-antitoxin system RelE/ParE family toxin [Candidatus Moeniiplasma glomeromycotorum]|nr:type II toxin-antitoxin system RelE/ParE family toxin [Candidatus Moeniiplasma glomeromycotorum]
MIINFKDKEAEALFQKLKSPLYQNIKKVALRKLIILDEAKDLRELSKLPNNRLEKLKGAQKTYSIRINDQYRIVFDWIDTNAHAVSINKHDKNYGK